MQTYAETVGAPVMNWAQILGRDCEDISIPEADELRDAAVEWPMCAVGQLCASIPRNENGAPLDLVLLHLGADFVAAVGDMRTWIEQREINSAEQHRRRALHIHAKIEARAAVLLAQMNH